VYTVRERKKIKACGEVYPSSRIGILNRVRERKLKYAVKLALLENGLLVPVTGRVSAGPCGRH